MTKNAAWSPSEIVAERVTQLRKSGRVSREALAARCAKLGCPELTASALANIETGRRGAGGKRRRDVTIDEVQILAKAFGVPPADLLFPVLRTDVVEVLPGHTVDTLAALDWFCGHAPLPGENADAFSAGAAPLLLARMHRDALYDYMSLGVTISLTEENTADLERQRARALAALRDVRAEIQRHGYPLPALPEGLSGVDDPGGSVSFDGMWSGHRWYARYPGRS